MRYIAEFITAVWQAGRVWLVVPPAIAAWPRVGEFLRLETPALEDWYFDLAAALFMVLILAIRLTSINMGRVRISNIIQTKTGNGTESIRVRLLNISGKELERVSCRLYKITVQGNDVEDCDFPLVLRTHQQLREQRERQETSVRRPFRIDGWGDKDIELCEIDENNNALIIHEEVKEKRLPLRDSEFFISITGAGRRIDRSVQLRKKDRKYVAAVVHKSLMNWMFRRDVV